MDKKVGVAMKIKNGILDVILHRIKGLVTVFHYYITYLKENDIEINRSKMVSILEICQDMCRKAIDEINEAMNTNNHNGEVNKNG